MKIELGSEYWKDTENHGNTDRVMEVLIKSRESERNSPFTNYVLRKNYINITIC